MIADAIAELLATARREHNDARRAVVDWMEQQRELVQAAQAPGWRAYELALKRWHEALAAFDVWLAMSR